ncbi:hypothetical protein MettiDRAFT_2174 [Methanolobus tindarius DSM 2278]|uniref:Uncharacterized protein n=1 Tax=Methanolobus tindarius DSM 2278 TaxID=1090322 RepID=W9DSC7_METTI|nr:hypothetical protein MettiDRAFT_2174 [Methanolobus tindarius DSM 2278]
MALTEMVMAEIIRNLKEQEGLGAEVYGKN